MRAKMRQHKEETEREGMACGSVRESAGCSYLLHVHLEAVEHSMACLLVEALLESADDLREAGGADLAWTAFWRGRRWRRSRL